MIFISYRVADSEDITARLDDTLADEFGQSAVFRDRSRLKPGQDWSAEIQHHAESCQVMLVVIGQKWKSAAYTDDDREGQLRLDDPHDWVRREITLGLNRSAHVIPVLLNDTKLPSKAWLAKFQLDALVAKQTCHIRTRDYDHDIQKLIQRIRELCPTAPNPDSARQSKLAAAPKQWQPAILYPLQPAPHFAGREKLLAELTTWATTSSTPTRVLALVAPGGTGKTALAERLLTTLTTPHPTPTPSQSGERDDPQSNTHPFGIFVWSFYENPQTEAFLRAACEYFTGESLAGAGGLIERLQRALADGVSHFLILDGLELVQSSGTGGYIAGELEDRLLRRFVRWLAAVNTNVKALITSRVPLPDLHDWLGNQFHEVRLEDLSPQAALNVLRNWGVAGDDKKLSQVLRSLQGVHAESVHALSVSVLGAYLGKLWNGDVSKAPSFDAETFATIEPKAAKLTRILSDCASKLSPVERDLMVRLALFTRGVSIDIILHLVDAGGSVAGNLVDLDADHLLVSLHKLRDLGFLFRYTTLDGHAFSAHPFLREYFATRHEIANPCGVHEVIRSKLSLSLSQHLHPRVLPYETKVLDLYEHVIEETRLAGHTERAFWMYWSGLGGFGHLGHNLADFSRGLRILTGFLPADYPKTPIPSLHPEQISSLVIHWGYFAMGVGDLPKARRAIEIRRSRDSTEIPSTANKDLAQIEIWAGCWVKAQHAAEIQIAQLEGNRGSELIKESSEAYLAASLFALGRIDQSLEHFKNATQVRWRGAKPLGSLRGLMEIECKLARGELRRAREHLEFISDTCPFREEALRRALLGRAALPADLTLAKKCLEEVRFYCGNSNHLEAILRAYHLAAEIARHEEKHPQALAEANAGIELADSTGFGRWSIDIRLELAKIHLANQSPQQAIEPAQKALDLSEHPDSQYAWGIADAHHLLGVAHARLNQIQHAKSHLEKAIEKRTSLEHPELTESQAQLAQLPT